MVRTLGRKLSWPRSFSFRKMFDGRNSGHSSFSSRGDGMHTPECELAAPSTRRVKQNRRSGIYNILVRVNLVKMVMAKRIYENEKLYIRKYFKDISISFICPHKK